MGKLRKVTSFIAVAAGIAALAALFVMSLPIGGWRALSVQTGSMAPAIRPGSLVFVHRVPETSLKVGDVITYASATNKGSTLTHRIVELKNNETSRQVIVKGDANQVADSPVAPSQIVGKVTASIPVLGRISDFVHKPMGLILLVYIPALAIIIFELRLLLKRLVKIEVAKDHPTAQSEINEPEGTPETRPLVEKIMAKPVVPRPRSLDGFRVILVLGLAVLGIHSTHAALNSQATLTGTTITSAPTQPPTGTCSSSTNTVVVINTGSQTAISGSASVNNSATGGSATSGNAVNTNSTTTTIVQNHC